MREDKVCEMGWAIGRREPISKWLDIWVQLRLTGGMFGVTKVGNERD